MIRYWVLDANKNPRPAGLIEWGLMFESPGRQVGDNRLTVNGEAVRVSTVFLGIDHSFGVGPPILFETMIFGGKHSEYQTRCATWNEAVEMHQVALDLVTEEATAKA